jgi:hypothetical protein
MRCVHTPLPAAKPSFRTLSYNLLADQYAGSTYAQQVRGSPESYIWQEIARKETVEFHGCRGLPQSAVTMFISDAQLPENWQLSFRAVEGYLSGLPQSAVTLR